MPACTSLTRPACSSVSGDSWNLMDSTQLHVITEDGVCYFLNTYFTMFYLGNQLDRCGCSYSLPQPELPESVGIFSITGMLIRM